MSEQPALYSEAVTTVFLKSQVRCARKWEGRNKCWVAQNGRAREWMGSGISEHNQMNTEWSKEGTMKF